MYRELENTVHEIMRDSIANREAAGVNLLVEKDFETVLCCQEGLADREKGRRMERDTILRIYSMTKPITAAAVMILMERGMLDLCQPVGDFIPEFSQMKIERNGKYEEQLRPILVHDLLRMTSGLVYPGEDSAAARAAGMVFDDAVERLHTENPVTTIELARRLSECPLLFQPGSSWCYGASADILGALVEIISGKRFSEFLQEEIFAPLGMEDTGFWVPGEKRERLASVYETAEKEDGTRTMKKYEGNYLAIRNDMARPPAYEAGGAGLVSTLDDYMKFARMLLNEGAFRGGRILRAETVRFFTGAELMDIQQTGFNKWIGLEGYTYGNLMRVCRRPSRCCILAKEGEYGWDGWTGMYFANFPKEKMTILMGTQKKEGATFALTRKLRNVILSSLQE
ncbi:MAG TPA: beta-lactamase family protein [Candidatus Blautia faecipullorum]|nr:beta-lactamase family protein [Candidatus Blautia faecipullorum]